MRGAPTALARGAAATTRPAGLATPVPAIPMPIPAWCCAFATTGSIKAKLATIQIRRIVHLPGDPTPSLQPIIPRLPIHPTLKRCADGHRGFMRAYPKRAHPLRLPPARSASLPAHQPLFPNYRMCYNRRAVERTVKAGAAPIELEPGRVISEETAVTARDSASEVAANSDGSLTATVYEDVSRYCPVCSQRLESRRCKLLCPVCGYYMSCADYY